MSPSCCFSLPNIPGDYMQNEALNILSSRLAKGEITEDEYDRLVTKLGAASTGASAKPDSDFNRPSATISGNSKQPAGNMWASWIGGVVGLYFAACILLAFAASPSTAAASVNDGCRQSGGSLVFCQCYATEAVKGYSFISAPLWFVGIGRVSPTQANYICNSR